MNQALASWRKSGIIVLSCAFLFILMPIAKASEVKLGISEISDEVAPPKLPIAKSMREYQARYHAVYGGYIKWPANADETPAPAFPSDDFYDQDMMSPVTAVRVVEALQNAYADPSTQITSYYINETSGQYYFSPSSQVDVTPANYASVYNELQNQIGVLQVMNFGRIDSQLVTDCILTQGQSWNPEDPYTFFKATCGEAIAALSVCYEGPAEQGPPFCNAEASTSLNDYGWIASYIHQRGTVTVELLENPDGGVAYYGEIMAYHRSSSSFSNFWGYVRLGSTPPGIMSFSKYINLGEPLPTCDYDQTSGYVKVTRLFSIGCMSITHPIITPDPPGPPCSNCCGGNGGSSGGSGGDSSGGSGVGAGGSMGNGSGGTWSSGETSLNSLCYAVSLGNTNEGRSFGIIYLHEEEPSAALSTPAKLKWTVADESKVHLTAGGKLDYIEAPQGTVNVVVTNSYIYELQFHDTTGAISKTIKIENPAYSTSDIDTLQITETGNKITSFVWDAENATWTLNYPENLGYETMKKEWDDAYEVRTETRKVYNSSNTLTYQEIKKYKVFPWGEEQIEEQNGTGDDIVTTRWRYYGDTFHRFYEVMEDGETKMIFNMGDDENHPLYDDVSGESDPKFGRLKSVEKQIGNVTTSKNYTYVFNSTSKQLTQKVVTSGSTSIETNYYWASQSIGAVTADLVVESIEKVNNNEVGRNYGIYLPADTTDPNNPYREEYTIKCASAISVSSLDSVIDAPGDHRVTYIMKRHNPGNTDDGRVLIVTHPDGTSDVYAYETLTSSGHENHLKTTLLSGKVNFETATLAAGTKTVTEVDEFGNFVSGIVYDGVTEDTISSEMGSDPDVLGRMQRFDYLDGTHTLTEYGCCGVTSITDKNGTETTYTYDALKRITGVGKPGETLTYTLDPKGNILTETRNGVLLKTMAYDTANRLTSITGSGTHPVKYVYGAENGLFYRKEIKLDDTNTETGEWVQNDMDFDGRIVKTAYPDGAFSEMTYDGSGQLLKQSEPHTSNETDFVQRLFQYRGDELQYTAIDMDHNGVIDFDGTDRITRTTTDVVDRGSGAWVRRMTTEVYDADNAATTKLISKQETSLNGLESWSYGEGITTPTHSVYAPNGTTATRTVTNPDGSTEVTTYQNGRALSVTRSSNSSQISRTTYTYGTFNDVTRIATMIVTEGNGSHSRTTTYDYDAAGRPTSMMVSAMGVDPQTTTYIYDAMGRQTQIDGPDAAGNGATFDDGMVHNEYYSTGELKRKWGARTYPVSYEYDYAGRMTKMSTWQTFIDPENAGGAAETRWNYNTRGLLVSKRYNDNTGPDYEYYSNGRLKKRTWARLVNSQPLTTTYTYNNAGDLVSVDYSDTTPDVGYVYDRRGRKTSVTDAAGTRTLTYTADNQLLSDEITSGLMAGYKVSYLYDNLGRKTSVSVLRNDTTVGTTTYTYTTASRLNEVINGTNKATYSYTDNSNLVSGIVFNNGSQDILTSVKSYDNLNRQTSVVSTLNNNNIFDSYSYEYNNANQRLRQTLSDDTYWTYMYDALGQLAEGKRHQTIPNKYVAGQQFEYDYDTIGNMTTSRYGGDADGNNLTTCTWGSNLLNQYTLKNGTAAYQNDADGNTTMLESYMLCSYDAENRLIFKGGTGTRNLKYDYMGRLIEAQFRFPDPDNPVIIERYVYDGWNLVAVFNNTNVCQRTYSWGTDLSGSFQGAGGIGGMLMTREHQSSPAVYFSTYDGNGNLTGLVKAADGVTGAKFLYNPYGKTLNSTSPYLAKAKFGFSTKYQPPSLGLIYFGYRYYNPETGRWINRDPIEEQGGVNLYNYVANDPIASIDPLGHSSLCGNLTMSCKKGPVDWPVYGDSDRAKFIVGNGCVTLLIPKGIYCTGSCGEIKNWWSSGPGPSVPILNHEACHACAFEDDGLPCYLYTWIPGDLKGYCNSNSKNSNPKW